MKITRCEQNLHEKYSYWRKKSKTIDSGTSSVWVGGKSYEAPNFLKWIYTDLVCHHGVVGRVPAFHPISPGSIPGRVRNFNFYPGTGSEGWLGFLDLWSGQKPWWNWYLTPVMNFGEVRRTQLAKLTFSSPNWCPWFLCRSFKVCSDAIERESGVQKATGSYHTYSSIVKLHLSSWVCGGRPAFGQNCGLGAWVCSVGPALD